jgi:hypothetical protein
LADACGQARAITVLTPVARESELQSALAALPVGPQSPLARLPRTHFARWVMVPGPGLLFSATYDRGDGAYLDEVQARLPDEADSVWCHCDGYPGMGADFVDYLDRHRVQTDLFVAAYPDASLEDVQRALTLRRRLSRFVVRAQGMSPEALRAAFAKERLG